jgi:hypothetical protein
MYLPQWEGYPVISPGTGFHFYDSQGYGVGVLTSLHTETSLLLETKKLLKNDNYSHEYASFRKAAYVE